MVKLLALDCSTEACSVALYANDGTQAPGAGEVLGEESVLAAREHTQQLLPMVQRVLAGAGWQLSDLDACAFGRGPGSFTGLRVALGAVQGLAFGADLPVLPVSTLAGLAQTWWDSAPDADVASTIVAAIDARMGEVYWGVYSVQDGLVESVLPEQLTPPDGITLDARWNPATLVGVGSGWNYIADMGLGAVPPIVEPGCLPAASAIARLADDLLHHDRQVPAAQALPRYLRDEVAWQKS